MYIMRIKRELFVRSIKKVTTGVILLVKASEAGSGW